jgi:hypothetical protein
MTTNRRAAAIRLHGHGDVVHLPASHDPAESPRWTPLTPQTRPAEDTVNVARQPEEKSLLIRPCACGCGRETARDFAQGHDMKAVRERVREHFGGSVLALIRWIDSAYPRPAS